TKRKSMDHGFVVARSNSSAVEGSRSGIRAEFQLAWQGLAVAKFDSPSARAMDFREYAANETTRSINSLFAASAEASRQQLEGLRVALDATTRALDSALSPSSKVDHDLAALVDHLAAAATVAAEQA